MGCAMDTQMMPETPSGRFPFATVDPNTMESTADKPKFGEIHQRAADDISADGTQQQDQFHLGMFLMDKFSKKQPTPGNSPVQQKSLQKSVQRKSAINTSLVNTLMKRNQSQLSELNRLNLEPLIMQLRLKYKKFRKEAPIKPHYDVNDLKQEIRSIYVGVIKEKLMQANDNKITIEECKIEISQQALQVQILSLKYIMENAGYRDGIMFYEEMGKFLKQLTGFLKTKYPRSEVLDSGELGKEIKEINATEEYEYDMLKNAGFTFNSTDDLEITRTIKLFLNKIVDELEVTYPKFKQLIESSFSPQKTQQKNAEKAQEKPSKEVQQRMKQLYMTNYKIGRKISQNTAKYTKLQTGTIEVKSAQIQRVLIKWLQDLMQMILKPREVITQKNEYKFYTIEKGESQVTFTKCTENKCQQLIEQGLINRIQDYSSKQHQKHSSMRRQFNEFNMNLINIFNLVQHSQHQVSKEQMQVIKFSYYNSDFISWIVEEQLIHSIKTLVEVGQQYSQSGGVLDLIKFKCNDLMRCQFFGNKKKVMLIYKEFQRLDKIRALEIIKIKNRFETLMGDAMIFFKLPGSFIICECQLILSNEGKGEDAKKAKNIEVINHFLYELQRSPFGVLGQIGVFLKSKSQTVSSYCHILQLSREKNISECLSQHKQPQRIEQQQKPFVCSKCVKFYPKYSNLFKIHECDKCLIKICNFCLDQKFQITEGIMKAEFFRRAQRFQQEFKLSEEYKAITSMKPLEKKDEVANLTTEISLQKFYDKKLKELVEVNTPPTSNPALQALNPTPSPSSPSQPSPSSPSSPQQSNQMKGLNDLFKDKRIKMKDLFKSNKIKVQLIINYLQKQYQNQLKNDQKIMFVIATWKKSEVKFKLYDYNPEQNNIVNSYQQLQKYEKHEFIRVSDYDLILEIKSFSKVRISEIRNQQPEDLTPSIFEKGIYVFDGQDKMKMLQAYNKLVRTDSNSNENYVVYYEFFPFYLIIDFDHSVKGSKSDGWVEQYLKSVPDLFLFRKNIQLNNQSIHNKDLVCFDRLQWVLSIKILNLNENKISDISKVLENCVNIEELSIRENKIKELVFNKPLDNLKYLNAGKNESIERVRKLHNIINVQELDLSDNKIAYIIVDDDEVPIVEKIEKPKKGDRNGENKENQGEGKDGKDSNGNKDKDNTKAAAMKAATAELLQRLSQKKKYTFPHLTKLNLTQNKLQSILQFSVSEYPSLTQLYLNDNQLSKMPKVLIPRLKKLDVSYNNLTTIDDFVKSQLTHLVQLYLNDNKFGKVPALINVPKLKKIDLCYNHITKLQNFLKADYPQLAEFYFTDNKLTTLPKFNTPKIQIIHLDCNIIESLNEFIKGVYPELMELNLDKNKLVELPQLGFPLLKRIDFCQNQIRNVEEFAKVEYPNLHEVDLSYNKLVKFPKLTAPNLHKIVLEENLIDSIKEFAEGDYPKLTAFSISYSTSSDPSASEKKTFSDQEIIIIENISKPKESDKSYSEREKLHSERGAAENPLENIIKEISQAGHPSVQDYYKTFLEAQEKVRGKDDVIEAATFKNMGLVFLQEENYEKAIEYYQKSLQLTINIKGENNFDYTSTLVELANVYAQYDNFEEALSNYQRSLQIIEKLKGKDNQYYISTLLRLAALYLRFDQKFVAVQMYEDCLKLQEKVKRKDSIECSEILKKIGQCYSIIGDFTKSLESYERCLKIQLKVKGKRTIEVAQTMIRIGSVYYQKGDNSKALENYEKGVEIQKKVVGQESEEYAINLKSIIDLYSKQNLYEKAIFYSERYLDIMEKNRGEEDEECTSTLTSLAAIQVRIGTKEAYEKALLCHERCLRIQQSIIQKHEQKGRQLYEIKQEQHLQEMKSRADQPILKTETNIDGLQSKRTLSPLEKILNFHSIEPTTQQKQQLTPQQQHFNEQKRNNHYNMGLTYHNIGCVYELLDQHENALKVYESCYNILEYIESDESENCIVVLDKIGNIYYKKKGELHKAIENHQLCLEIKEKVYGQDSNGCIKTLQVLAELNAKVNKHEAALENMRKCHKIQEQIFGQENPEVVASLFRIAEILVKLQDHTKALETLEKCMKIYEKLKGKQCMQVAQIYQKQAEVYDNQNVNKRAIEFGERTLALKQKLKTIDCPELINTLCMLGKVYLQEKLYDKSTSIITRCLSIIDLNSTIQFSQHPLLYYYLGQISLLSKDSSIQRTISSFQRSIQLYQKQNPYIFIFLPSQSTDNFPSPHTLHQPFYPTILQKLSDCYEILEEKENSLIKIKECYEIVRSQKGEEHDESRRLMAKMIRSSGESFVHQIIGKTVEHNRVANDIKVTQAKEDKDKKMDSLDRLKKLIIG